MRTELAETLGAKLKWLPVFLSAVVFPGLGQVLQKRWKAAAAYALCFAVVSSWFVKAVFPILYTYYEFAFNFDTVVVPEMRLTPIAVTLFVSLVVYMFNIYDVVAAMRRQQSERRTREFEANMEES